MVYDLTLITSSKDNSNPSELEYYIIHIPKIYLVNNYPQKKRIKVVLQYEKDLQQCNIIY